MPVNIDKVLAARTATIDPQEPPEAPSVSAIFGSAFRQYNSVSNVWRAVSDMEEEDFRPPGQGPVEDDYDPFENIEGTVFEDFPEYLIGVESADERERVRQRAEAELEDRQTLSESGGLGFLASLAAGVLDPLVLFPTVGAASKARAVALAGRVASGTAKRNILAGGIVAGRTAVIGETAVQGVLQATQETRTLGESAIDVTAAAVLGSMMGASIVSIPEGSRALMRRQIQRDFEPAVAGGVGKDDGLSVGPADLEPTIDADGNVTSPAEPKVARAVFGIEKRLGKLPAVASPFLKVLVRSPAATMKRSLLELGDSSARVVEGLDLPRSAESDVIGWDSKLAELYTANDRLFVKHRLRKKAQARLRPGESVDVGGIHGGRFSRLRRNAIGAFDKAFGKESQTSLSPAEFRKEVARALRSGDKSAIPEVQEAAELWRTKFFDPAMDELIELGVLPESIRASGPKGARSYLTRYYLSEKMIAREDEFKDTILKPWLRAKLDEDELAAIAKTGESVETVVARESDSIFENIVGLHGGRIIVAEVPGSTASPLKARALDLGDEILEDFLEQDIDVIGERYLRTVIPDIILRKRGFRGEQLQARKDAIVKEFSEARKGKSEKARKKLAKQQREELRLLDDLISLLDNTYTGGRADRAVGKPLRVLRSLNFLAFGGGMMVSSIPDVGRQVQINGFRRSLGTALAPLTGHLRGLRMASDEARLAGAGLEWSLDSRSRFWYELGDETHQSRLDRHARNAANFFGVANLLAPWNVVMKRWAGVTLQTRLIDSLDNLSLGRTISKRDMRDLDFLRLGPRQREGVMRMIREHGFESDGPLKWANTTAWQDVEARQAFRAAIRFGTDQTIVTPGLLDRPPFMSTELGRTFFQFLSFAFASTNRILLSALQNPRDLATWTGLSISMALGMGVESLKNRAAGRPESDPDSLTGWIGAGVDRSGAIGIFGDIYNKTAPLWKADQLSSRYAARNAASTALGPSMGTFESLYRAGASVLRNEITESEVRNMRRLLPYNQLFYVRSLFDAAEEGVNETFDVPQSRSRRRR